MKLLMLVEGPTDVVALEEIVKGVADSAEIPAPTLDHLAPPTRCAGIRQAAGETLRAADRRSVDALIVVTDAVCNVEALGSDAGKNRAKVVGRQNAAYVESLIEASVKRCGIKEPVAIGVPCADLETWFLLSPKALEAVGAKSALLDTDPEPACEDDSARIDLVGKEKLEEHVAPYNAVKARKMAKAAVESRRRVDDLRSRSASFARFADRLLSVLTKRPEPSA